MENTKRASPAGRRAREDSAGGVAGKISELGTSRPTKKTKTLNGWVDGADVAGGPGTAAAAAVAAVEAAVEAAGVWGGGAPFLLEPALDTPLRKDQVRVELSEAYSRKPHPDREVRTSYDIRVAVKYTAYHPTNHRTARVSSLSVCLPACLPA